MYLSMEEIVCLWLPCSMIGNLNSQSYFHGTEFCVKQWFSKWFSDHWRSQRSPQRVYEVKTIFIITLRPYLPVSLSFFLCVWYHNRWNAETHLRIQLSFVKPDIKEICKNVNQYYSFKYFLGGDCYFS